MNEWTVTATETRFPENATTIAVDADSLAEALCGALAGAAELTPGEVARYLAQHGFSVSDGGQAETDRLTRLAESLGADWVELGEYVHDLASTPASGINNDGLAAQVAYLVREAGPAEAERMIREAAGAQGGGPGPAAPEGQDHPADGEGQR